MTRAFVFTAIAISVFLMPLYVTLLVTVCYVWRWGGFEIVLLGILFDWLLLPTWPLATVSATLLALFLPSARRVTMLSCYLCVNPKKK